MVERVKINYFADLDRIEASKWDKHKAAVVKELMFAAKHPWRVLLRNFCIAIVVGPAIVLLFGRVVMMFG
jgi:hypothetical protein